MAVVLPPPPIGEPAGSFAWQQWYLALGNLYSGTGTVPWELIDTSGSDIQDIASRAHNNLQTIQGGTTGEFYHLTSAQHTEVSSLLTTLSANFKWLKGSKTHDFGSIASGAADTTTITVTGAPTTAVVSLGYSSTPETEIEYRAWVSGADTVTLQAINRSGGAVDPASRTYYVLVMDN